MLAALLAAAALAAPVTEPATEVGATSATLNGKVDAPSEVYFEYGTTTSYGLRTADETVAAAGPVQERIEGGLTVDTLYHYRIVDTNGTPDTADDIPGNDVTFRTAGPPAVSNQLASNVTATQATVSATVDTKGLPTSYRIQWGTTTGYGRFTAVETADSGTPTTTVTLTGLQPNRTYHWRTRASNAAGTTLGRDRTFRTAPLPTGVTLSLSRGTVPWGDGVRLGGRVTGSGVRGLTVVLEQQRVGLDPGFTAVGTARTGSDGGYLFTIPRLWTSTRYRVLTQTQDVATSPVATVLSRVRVTSRARHVSRRRARVQGSVLPAVDGTVTLQLHKRGRGWRRVRTALLSPGATSSRYSFSVQRVKRVARRFRVVVTPAGETHVRGWSGRVLVKKR
jgi:Fibronectin type III domain